MALAKLWEQKVKCVSEMDHNSDQVLVSGNICSALEWTVPQLSIMIIYNCT